jgi:hypothetical protein
MHQPPQKAQLSGTAVHVRDCYVWAEIQYLDSTTDYREYLHPEIQADLDRRRIDFEVMRTRWQQECLYASIFIGLLSCLFLLLVSRY